MERKEENLSKKEMTSWLAYLFEIQMCQEFWQKSLYKLALVRSSLDLAAVWESNGKSEGEEFSRRTDTLERCCREN